MKKKVISSLVVACACVLAAGVTQLNGVPASAASISYTNESSPIQMVSGASVRVSQSESSGIRFAAQIDKAAYDALETENGAANVSAGIIIVPSDYLGGDTGATAFTHEALSEKYGTAYSYKETSGFVLNGDYYEFAYSLTDLKEYNYARDFCATAYVKVGDSYTYASFNQETDARNIYEVASDAYNDRSTTQEGKYTTEIDGTYSKLTAKGLEAAKGYMDKIADIKVDDGALTIANNTDYYTSPYAIIGEDGNYAIDGKGVTPVGLFYDGDVVRSDYITDGETQVAVVRSSKATYEGTVATVENGLPANTNPALVNYQDYPDGYVAFNGEYGVGTFIDVTFTGNNMPYVTFFADEINGIICSAGGTGLMAINGLITSEKAVDETTGLLIHSRDDIFKIYTSRQNANIHNAAAATGELAKMTQKALSADETKQYKLTAGTVMSNGKVNLYLALVDATTGAEIARTLQETSLTSGSGNIILFGCMKGENTTTAFSYSMPYAQKVDTNEIVKSQGAIWNSDGSVSLKGVVAANANPGNVKLVSNSYVAFDAEYGLGTTVEVEFQGNNMPYIMFCADEINGDMTSNGGKGYLMINGMVTKDTTTVSASGYVTHTRDDIWTQWNSFSRMDANIDSKAPASGGFENLTQAYLKEHATTNFKLQITFKANWQGTVIVYKTVLTNMDTNEAVVSVSETTTGRTASESQTLLGKDTFSGKIILYANMKGEDAWTTFKYTVPTQA